MGWPQTFMLSGSIIGACYWMHRENKKLYAEIRVDSNKFTKDMREFHMKLFELQQSYFEVMQHTLKKRDGDSF